MLFVLLTDEGFIEVEPDSAYDDLQDEPSLEAENSKLVEEEAEVSVSREEEDYYDASEDTTNANNAFKGASQVRV